MKGNLNILKSKFIKVFIAAILAVILFLSVLLSLHPGMKLFSAEEMAALTGDKFETIFPLGEFEEIYVADSEAGIFLVKRADKTKLIDTLAAWPGTTDRPTACHMLVTADGQALAHFPYGEVRSSAGGNFVIKEEDRWYFVNSAKAAESEIYTGKHYDYAEIDASGKYVLVKEEGTYKVLDAEGNEVYVPHYQEYEFGRPDLIGPEGYIVEDGPGDHFIIVNFITGETEYQVPEGIRVSGYSAGHWFMDCAGEHDGLNFSYYYMLDRDYNLAADGAIFTALNISSSGNSAEYISVQQEYDVTYDNRHVMADRGLFDIRGAMKRVYNSRGEIVYDGADEESLGSHGSNLRYIRGNMLAVSGYNEKIIDYINLDTGEVIFEDEELFCFMDFEDGVAAAVKNKQTEDGDGRDGDLLNDESNMKKYRWCLVDENMQPLTEFVFDGVYPGNNGYAVVIKDGGKGLIRLKGAE